MVTIPFLQQADKHDKNKKKKIKIIIYILMTAHLTGVRSYLLKPSLCFCFLIFKHQCKNIICYVQHTAITFVTFATAHCSSIFCAVTVEHVASDSPVRIASTALLTFTFRPIGSVWATLLAIP